MFFRVDLNSRIGHRWIFREDLISKIMKICLLNNFCPEGSTRGTVHFCIYLSNRKSFGHEFCTPFTAKLKLGVVVFKDTLSGLRQFLAIESLESDEKCFLFHLKSSFRSQDI